MRVMDGGRVGMRGRVMGDGSVLSGFLYAALHVAIPDYSWGRLRAH